MDFFSKLDVLFPGRFGGLSSAWVFDILGAKLRHEIDQNALEDLLRFPNCICLQFLVEQNSSYGRSNMIVHVCLADRVRSVHWQFSSSKQQSWLFQLWRLLMPAKLYNFWLHNLRDMYFYMLIVELLDRFRRAVLCWELMTIEVG